MFYVIQIQTGEEEKFLKLTAEILSEDPVSVHWLRKSLCIRKLGMWSKKISSIFPGYLFVYAEEISDELLGKFKKIQHFAHFLRTNREIIPLETKEEALISHFISYKNVAGASQVWFDENNRIVVKSGPLKGLEGYIIKVNRRKKRAKIKLDIYKKSFPVDLAFEIIQPVKQK